MATAQLQLIESDRPWKLDRRTVEIGRVGLAQARAALAAADAPQLHDVEVEVETDQAAPEGPLSLPLFGEQLAA